MSRSYVFLLAVPLYLACNNNIGDPALPPIADSLAADSFKWEADHFGDVRVLRYQIPGWELLSAQQKELAYYLTQAGLAGRDIMWDQNYRYNLRIRRSLEAVIKNHQSGNADAKWDAFMEYAKEVFFSNGIHHHYGMDKFNPGFDRAWYEGQLKAAGHNLAPDVLDAMFDPAIDNKKVSLDPEKDLLLASAVNFYGEDVSEKEATDFYAAMEKKDDPQPLSYGINSKLVRTAEGKLAEQVWRVGGMYGAALEKCIEWLIKAQGVAENEQQKKVIGLLIEFYRSGDLAKWDEFNVEWVKETAGTVDFIMGFVEVYNDPIGKRGSYESCVEVNDPEATKNMSVIQKNAQRCEDDSPTMDQLTTKE